MFKKYWVYYEASDGLNGKIQVKADSEKHALEVGSFKLQGGPYPCFVRKAEEIE